MIHQRSPADQTFVVVEEKGLDPTCISFSLESIQLVGPLPQLSGSAGQHTDVTTEHSETSSKNNFSE